jgi:hypothetical protein
MPWWWKMHIEIFKNERKWNGNRTVKNGKNLRINYWKLEMWLEIIRKRKAKEESYFEKFWCIPRSWIYKSIIRFYKKTFKNWREARKNYRKKR